jgi:hypothetical protein
MTGCGAHRIRRATDRVHVVMISTTDGVLEEKVVEQVSEDAATHPHT